MKKLLYSLAIIMLLIISGTAKAQTQSASQSVAALGNTLSDFISQRAASNQLKQSNALSAYNKQVRGFLYQAACNFSDWYLASSLNISTANSAVSDSRGDPDYMSSSDNASELASINDEFSKKDGIALAKNLSDGVYRCHTSYFPAEMFATTDLSESKNLPKIIKKADKGKFPDMVTMVYFYSRSLSFDGMYNTPQDLQNGERYFNLIMADKSIQNGGVPKTKPFTQCLYLLRANMYLSQKSPSKEDLLMAEKSLATAGSVCNLHNYTVDNASQGSYYADFYFGQEAVYDFIYLAIKNAQLETYSALMNRSDTTPAEKSAYNNKILQLFTETGNNPDMRAMYKSPVFNRPYTDDMEWDKHHGY